MKKMWLRNTSFYYYAFTFFVTFLTGARAGTKILATALPNLITCYHVKVIMVSWKCYNGIMITLSFYDVNVIKKACLNVIIASCYDCIMKMFTCLCCYHVIMTMLSCEHDNVIMVYTVFFNLINRKCKLNGFILLYCVNFQFISTFSTISQREAGAPLPFGSRSTKMMRLLRVGNTVPVLYSRVGWYWN
jgi:hypothetical protein